MSTRATYEFKASKESLRVRSVTVYIHHDGYENGAAMYFWDAMRQPSKGCLATQFIRANGGAELTASHEQHGDTEYRYTIEGDSWERATVTVRKRDYNVNEWRITYVGLVVNFLERHPDLLANFDPFQTLLVGYAMRTLNTHTARRVLAHPYSHLEVWHRSSPFGGKTRQSANWQNCEREVRALCAAFPALAQSVDRAIVDLSS